jgi:hypothetical protein
MLNCLTCARFQRRVAGSGSLEMRRTYVQHVHGDSQSLVAPSIERPDNGGVST